MECFKKRSIPLRAFNMVIYVFTLRRVCYLTGESMYGKDYGHACGDSMRISRGLLEMYAVCASRSYCYVILSQNGTIHIL